MRIIQTTFGVFHHFELARELHRRGHLQRIYSTWPWRRLRRESCPRDLVRMFPWIHTPEMLLRRSPLSSSERLLHELEHRNTLAFDWFVTRQLRRETMPQALIALSGSSLRAGTILQQQGGRYICDRGSSHHRFQERIVSEEYRRWGVNRSVTDVRAIRHEEKIYEQADAITVPSSFARSSFLSMGVPASKLHVIPYGVRLENFHPLSEPTPNVFQVLFAGAVSLRKGVPYLLRAFAQLQHPRKKLILAGSIQNDVKAVLKLMPQEHVEYFGSVSQRRLAGLMSSSNLMVLPSIEEGLALVQGQALACGCPVLASTNTGAEDLFTDAVEGFIVPIRSAFALLQRMQQVADDSELQRRLRHAALARTQAIGGWTDYGNRWEALLYKLIGTSPLAQ